MTLPQPAPDLYEILGISRDATPEEIKAAYRAASKRTHPDMTGGSAAEFAKVQHAWNILGDPETRASYDRTGEAGAREPDNALARMHSIIMGALDRAMRQADLDHSDLVTLAVKLLGKDEANGQATNRDLADTRAKFEKVRKRLSYRGDGVDLVDRTLVDRIREIDRNIATNEATMARVSEAIEALKNGWSYEFDEREDPLRGGSGDYSYDRLVEQLAKQRRYGNGRVPAGED